MPFVCRHGHRRCYINTSGWPQNVPDQHSRMVTDCARSTLQVGHRLCYIKTSGWPQTVLDQHSRMATDCATLTQQDGHRLCQINTAGWPQTVPGQHSRMATDCATFSLIPSHVGKVTTVLPSSNKMQFPVSRLTVSASKLRLH